ncbi:uncharacterized protein LOC144085825 [Stigmatopora argus]
MAASCTVFSSACKATALVPRGQWYVTSFLSPIQHQCLRPQTTSFCSPATEAQRKHKGSSGVVDKESDIEGPEYIPLKKAKNPMMKIGYAWMIGLPTGIIGFLLAKRQVDKNRLKQLKIRQRMRRSNEGDYEGSRYCQTAETVKLDQ